MDKLLRNRKAVEAARRLEVEEVKDIVLRYVRRKINGEKPIDTEEIVVLSRYFPIMVTFKAGHTKLSMYLLFRLSLEGHPSYFRSA